MNNGVGDLKGCLGMP